MIISVTVQLSDFPTYLSWKFEGGGGGIGILDGYFTQLEIKYINACCQILHHFNKAATLCFQSLYITLLQKSDKTQVQANRKTPYHFHTKGLWGGERPT